jgi:hypothetical protein
MTYKQKRVFFNWLKQHNALEKYKYNRFVFMREYKKCGWFGPIPYSSIGAFDALGMAFSWAYTPEGHAYWSDLDEIWMKEYRKVMGRVL